MNKMRIFGFMTTMVIAAVSIAAGIYAFTSYREGGIFDNSFRSKFALTELTSNNEEVLEGLPSTTIEMKAELENSAVNPLNTLEDSGRLISIAVKDPDSTVSSQVTNIHYVATNKDMSERMDFRFNASTPVDYSDETYRKSISIFSALAGMGFSQVSFVSSPTPDGERSYDVEVQVKASTDLRGSDVSSKWADALAPMNRAINDTNMSSLTMISGGVASVSASFYDMDSYERAQNMNVNVWAPVLKFTDTKFANFGVNKAQYNMSALNAADDSLNVILSDKVEGEDKFNSLADDIVKAMKEDLEFKGMISNRIVIEVDGNPDLRRVIPSQIVVP